jgi:hypothetical protein
MTSLEQGATKPLEKIYQEASQWVRLVNTIIWSMGTLLVPISFGLLGVALNKTAGFEFDRRGKIVLGIGSVFLFGFWVYASRIYKDSVQVARKVLTRIERKWGVEKGLALYRNQQPIINKRLPYLKLPYGLFHAQMITLVALILIWFFILWRKE